MTGSLMLGKNNNRTYKQDGESQDDEDVRAIQR